MPKIDNDETKNIATPFLLIASKRSGGTYLAHCLSNHPQVFCDRGESMHHLSWWRKHLEPLGVFDLLTNQEGYKSSGFRMVYGQAFSDELRQRIMEVKPRVIWLTRENKLRQGVSVALNRAIRMGAARVVYHPVHTLKDTPPPRQTLDPDYIIKHCETVTAADRQAAKIIMGWGLPYLAIRYHEITGGEGVTNRCIPDPQAAEILRFLGVTQYPLRCELKRVYPLPLRMMFDNWADIEKAIQQTPFKKWLADEEAWIYEGGIWQTKT